MHIHSALWAPGGQTDGWTGGLWARQDHVAGSLEDCGPGAEPLRARGRAAEAGAESQGCRDWRGEWEDAGGRRGPPRPPAPGRPRALRGVSQAMRPSRCPLSWPHHGPPGAAQGWRGATPLPQLPWSGPSPTCPAAPTCAAPSGGGPAPSAVGPGPPRAPLRFQPERAVGSDAAPGTSRPAMHVPEPSSSRDCHCCQLPGSGGRAGMALRLPCPHCPTRPSFLHSAPHPP